MQIKINYTFADGEMAEWSNAAVLKTVVRSADRGFESLFLRQNFKAVPYRSSFFLCNYLNINTKRDENRSPGMGLERRSLHEQP